MPSKIEEEHEEYINTILNYDFDVYDSITNKQLELYDQRALYEAELKQVLIVSNRVTFVEHFLNNLPDAQITKVHKDAIRAYIQQGVELKWPISNYLRTGPLIKLKRALPDGPIWSKLDELFKQIDRVEDAQLSLSGNKEHYVKLLAQLKSISNLNDSLTEQAKNENEVISKIFYAEDIVTADELKSLCLHTSNKKTELMIIEGSDSIDYELAAVIHMKAKRASEKGNQLVIMSFDQFKKIIRTAQEIHGVTKLSFLHHGDSEFGYVNKISDSINHLPDLKEIVLRGCGTAKKPQNNLPVYAVKKINDTYDRKASVQGENQLLVQQKENTDGKIITKISWRAIDPREKKSLLHEIRDIENIPLITEKYPSDEQLAALESIPEIPLLKHSSLYINALKNTFFDPTKKISAKELADTKKAVRRARTESAHTQDDLLSEVLGKMTSDQKDRISVKGYVGGYRLHQGRVIPATSHDYENESKAVRVGSKMK